MMIFQDVPEIDSRCSGYTWDESWMLPYESIWSLMHKFSALNLISLLECKKLFTSDYAHGKVITELGGKLSLSKMVEVLGMGSGLDKNLVHEIVYSSDRPWLLSPYLRSCQTCLRHGYHSVFHQITTIKKCPIHQIELTVIACKSCGSSNQYGSLNINVSKLGTSSYACAKCGRKYWHPYDDTSSSQDRGLLVMTVEQVTKLDALHKWLVASAQIAPYGTDLRRWEGMAGMISFPAPIGMISHKKTIYKLRGHEISIFRQNITGLRPPNSITCLVRRDTTQSTVQYGFKDRFQKTETHYPPEPQFNDAGILCFNAPQGIQSVLRQVYKSIRRHIAKVFLNNVHRQCANSIERAMWWEPKADSNTLICPWAFAYLFWRRNWEKRMRVNQQNKYANWKNFLWVKISDADPVQNEWITLRVFALECYWTFQESVLLARGMYRHQKFSWDSALIRGRLIPYWHIDNQTNPRKPSIYWWGRQPIHFKALRLSVSVKRHHRDVAIQAKEIYRLPL